MFVVLVLFAHAPRTGYTWGFFVTILFKIRITSITKTHKTMARSKDEILESGVVHFRLGEDFGISITEIAQEHIQYNYDIRKGIDAIMGSFPGMELPMALKIIKGDYVIEVAENGEEVIVNTERNASHSRYPVFDIEGWIVRKYGEIYETGKEFIVPLQYNGGKFRYRERIIVDIPVSAMKSLFAGTLEGNDVLEYILADEKISNLYELLNIVKGYSKTSLQIHETITAVQALFGSELSENEKYRIGNAQSKALTKLSEVNKLVASIAEMDFDSLGDDDDDEFQSLKNYIESAHEIEETLSKGIEPVNIMDNYSAGWLAPDGTFYGLNGEIANMLHNQIADALLEKGVIDIDVVKDNDISGFNPDQWLEQHGWVKIHGNNVQFSGCNNYRIGKRNVDITDIQIKKIYEYISLCHNSIIRVGWKMERMSSTRFRDSIEMNRERMYKEYFEF